jgi:NADPH:quinone reductase-like Zn-dependent oxidoreductase
MATMMAARIHNYGGPEVIQYEEVPRPTPKDDELLIQVHAIGVNPVDWKLRSGAAQKMVPLPMPATLGGDICGVVAQAGSAATGFKPGDAVYALLGLVGAYAQYIVAKPAIVSLKPTSLDHIGAASVPLVALTAWQGLFDVGGLSPGQRVLIHAAAGGVGTFAVQLARWKGAHVIGTTSQGNAAYVRDLGAQEIIDYRTERFEQKVSAVDVVLDLIGDDTADRSISVLKTGGVLLQVVPGTASTGQLAAKANVRTAPVRVSPNGAQLRQIATLIDSGQVRTCVAEVFPLSQAGKAQERSASGHIRGKLVLNAL